MRERSLAVVYGMAAWAITAGVLLAASVLAINPSGLGPAGVTAWFVLLLSWLAAVTALLLFMLKTYFHVGDGRSMRWRYSWRQGLLLAGWLTGMLALSSLRQLGWRDAIITGVILILTEVYVRFRWP